MTDSFDYLIVGSGAAGASAARILADSTSSVAVLEEGPAVGTAHFEDRALTALSRLYRSMGAQITTGRAPMLVIQGRCVGGSTVINSAILRRLPEEVWSEWAQQPGLKEALPYADIDGASEHIERDLHGASTPETVWGGNNRLLSAAAAAASLGGSPNRRKATG